MTPAGAAASVITLSYDAENRLSQYVKKEGSSIVLTQTNRYNGEDQRIQKVEGSGTINYYYDVDTVLYTTNELNELTAVNHMGTQDNVICTSRFGEDSSESLYYYNKDIRESTTNLLDSSGNSVVSYQYTDFGETSIHGQEDFYNEICYTGGIYDEGTQLYYLNARYYNPADGRFLTEDTYRGESTDPSSMHLYAYCANNPITKADSRGHIAISRIIGAGVGGILGGYAAYRYAKKKGLKGWKKKAVIAGGAVAGAVAGALIGPRVAKVAKRVVRVAKKRRTKVYRKVIKKASKNKRKRITIKRKVAKAYRKKKCKVLTKITKKPHCFTGHTRIITRSGKKEIKDIEEGDEVPSANPYTGEISYKKVIATTRSETDTIVLVRVNGEELETTEIPPFWVEERGFVPAYALKKGDILRLADGSNASVESVEILHLEEAIWVYNFTVEDNHTYFVGDSGVWVHNARCAKSKSRKGRSGRQARLRELANDDKLSSALRGEIKRDINEIKRKKRKIIRVPSGYELSHRIGYPARQGYSYKYSDLNMKSLHRLHHRIFGYKKY